MLQEIKKQRGITLLWMLLAFHLLNCSVSVSLAFPATTTQPIYFNNQESIIELVVETMLGFEDAIPENNYNIPEEHAINVVSFAMEVWDISQIFPDVYNAAVKDLKAMPFPAVRFDTNPYLKISSPPPDTMRFA